ncbi:unnamed protein product, partial [Linum tenue]
MSIKEENDGVPRSFFRHGYPIVTEFKNKEENNGKIFAIEGQVTLIRSNWCYMGCVVCPRKVEEDLEEYFCGHCKTTAKANIEWSSICRMVVVKLILPFGAWRPAFFFFGVIADVLFQK